MAPSQRALAPVPAAGLLSRGQSLPCLLPWDGDLKSPQDRDLKSSRDVAAIWGCPPAAVKPGAWEMLGRVPPGAQLSLALSVSPCCCRLYAYCKLILMCANAIILQKLKSSLNL